LPTPDITHIRPASTTPHSVNAPFLLAAGFLVLSGVASLTYQVTWVRLLGLSMGSTSASISTVLAAFFLGMALGSYLAERITRNRIHNFTPYIVLELLIGLGGLALLPILLNLDVLMAQFPAFGTELGLKFVLAMVLLSIPTICMGATFPVMASILIRRQHEVGLRVSQLYSLNTAGAVLGAALSGFVFIPNWGLDGSIYLAFSLNMVIVGLALYFNKRWTLPPLELHPHETDSSAAAPDEQAPFRTRALLVLFATGFVSIATQVGWTKYLAIFTGTTIYGFAAILTVFLTGIAAGSWAIKSHLEKIRSPQLWMAAGLVLLGISLILTRAGLSVIPTIYGATNHLNVPAPVLFGVKYAFVFAMLFVPTFLFGALFPLNLKLYCGNLAGVRARIGKAYSINTVASIFGAILAGFWFIPEYGTDALLTIMAVVVLIMPFLFLPAIDGLLPRIGLVAAAGIAFFAASALPHLSYKELISSVDYRYDSNVQQGQKPRFLFLKEGKAGVISMVTYDDISAKLQNNGLNESIINMKDPTKALLVETLLGAVPYMLQESPKSAFVVGFGGGITTRTLTLTDLKSIRVVELEPAVVDAGKAIAGGKIPALQDPRVRIDFNDARNTLLVENNTYDIIAAQPSHPWLAGASSVFTREFWTIAKSRLNEKGVFGQWVNLFNMDATTLRSIFKAFYEVFPYGVTFSNLDTGDFILFGSKHPIEFDYDRIQKVLNQPKIKATLEHHSITTPRDLLWYFALSRKEAVAAAGKAPANSDTNILSEVRLSSLTRNPEGAENPYTFLHDHFQLDLAPYLGKNAAPRLYDQADYYFLWNDYILAEKAAKQLAKLDPLLGRGVEYERLWRMVDYDAAFKLYAAHPDWPDRTHAQQALALLELKREGEARLALARIKDNRVQRVAEAKALYELGNWQQLAALQPQNDEERKWQLVGLAKADLITAGKALSPLIEKDSDELPQLRVLAQYYGATGDTSTLDATARSLVKAIDKKTGQLKEFTKQALEKKQLVRAQLLIQKIETLNPKADDLKNLREQIAELERKQNTKPKPVPIQAKR
jgi:predicted membrane-bound spermidine synthase